MKGALLFIAHNISRHRPTRDIDFLGSSISNGKDEITDVIKEIIKIKSDDGLTFDDSAIEAEDIDEDGEYKGVRVKFYAYLEKSKERLQLDIGYGDKITSGPVDIDFPTILDFPVPKIKVYSIESAVAEKFEAIVSLQLQTSRMKDFYDILFLADNYKFKKDSLKEAVLATFGHRATDIEQRKKVFEEKFRTNEQLQKYWTAFLARTNLTAENNFTEVVTKISSFIGPIFNSDTKNNWNSKDWEWE